MNRRRLLAISLGLYVSSQVLPVCHDRYGWQLFIESFFLPLVLLANGLFAVAAFYLRDERYTVAANCAAVAFVVAGYWILVTFSLFANGPSYLLWAGSMALLAVGSVHLAKIEEAPRPAYPVLPTEDRPKVRHEAQSD